MGDLHFLYTLKIFFFLSHTYTQISFSAQEYFFFHYLSPFLGFSFQSNPHNEDPFLILGNTSFHYRLYIWIVTSLKSTTRQHRYNSFCKSFISSSVIQEPQKSVVVVARKIYFTLSPLNKTFTYSHKNTKHSQMVQQ